MVQYLLLYFTVLRYLKNWTVILRYDYKAGILLSTSCQVIKFVEDL